MVTAKQMANLIPAKPGEVRNPKGRQTAGASVREWWNSMANWTAKEIAVAVADVSLPVNKRAAAARWMAALANRDDLSMIIDHTAGRARQSMDVTAVVENSTSERVGQTLTNDHDAAKLALELADRVGESSCSRESADSE